MLKMYFRQALELMKQNKLFTWICKSDRSFEGKLKN